MYIQILEFIPIVVTIAIFIMLLEMKHSNKKAQEELKDKIDLVLIDINFLSNNVDTIEHYLACNDTNYKSLNGSRDDNK